MSEQQKKGTQKTTGNETEKTVHDLTKQEDLTRVLDQSLRALQEMEQRLQALEQELGNIGVRPGQPTLQKPQGGSSSGSQQYIGAPNPHGLRHPAAVMPMPPGLTATSPSRATYPTPYGTPYGSPYANTYAQNPASPYAAYPPAYGSPAVGAALGQIPGAGIDPRFARFAGAAAPGAADPMSGASSGSPVSEAMQLGQPEVPDVSGETGAPSASSDVSPQVRQAVMDVVDRNEEFLIHWELPGVKKDNLDIMVTDRSLILNAKAFPEHEDGVVVHTERPPSVYRRTVPFQTDVDTSKAKANLKDGVLTVHVPKRTPSKGPKRLDVAYG